jgi:hypothetical protein
LRVRAYYTAYMIVTAAILFLTGSQASGHGHDILYHIHILSKFGDDRIIFSKVTDNYLNSRWWLPPSFEKGSRRTGDVDIFRKGVINFLIAFHISVIDIYHSLSVKRRNVNKIPVFQLLPANHTTFRGVRGDPCQTFSETRRIKLSNDA